MRYPSQRVISSPQRNSFSCNALRPRFHNRKIPAPRGRKQKPACRRRRPRARGVSCLPTSDCLSRKRQRRQKRGYCPPSWPPTATVHGLEVAGTRRVPSAVLFCGPAILSTRQLRLIALQRTAHGVCLLLFADRPMNGYPPTSRGHWSNLPLTPYIEICTLSSNATLSAHVDAAPAAACKGGPPSGPKGDSPIFVASCHKNRDSPPVPAMSIRHRAVCRQTKLPILPMQYSPRKYKSTYDVVAAHGFVAHRLRAIRSTQVDATASRDCCMVAGRFPFCWDHPLFPLAPFFPPASNGRVPHHNRRKAIMQRIAPSRSS